MRSEQKNASNESADEWLGVWKNQYGSTIEIMSRKNGRIEGIFKLRSKKARFTV